MMRRILSVLFVTLSVGLLQRQLVALYARPVAVPTVMTAMTSEPSRREDDRIFSQALAAELLRQGTDGRIIIAPADLPLRRLYARTRPEWLAPRAAEPDWLTGPWDDSIRRLHQALHFSASGRYVRQQIRMFNARQWLAALRWRSATGLTGDWRAERNGAFLKLTAVMPPQAEQWFSGTPEVWQPWRRVACWPATQEPLPVRYRLTLARPAGPNERLELVVVGGAPTVAGATVLAEEPRCVRSSLCAAADAVAYWLQLEPQEGVTGLELDLSPLPAALFPGFRYEFSWIQREAGHLVWRAGAAPLRELEGGE